MNNELGSGALYIKLQRKLSENLLINYHRWVIDNKRKESVLTLRKFVLREAEFLSVASETIHGIATRRPEKIVDRQRTFYGQNQKETISVVYEMPCPVHFFKSLLMWEFTVSDAI